MLSFFNYRTIKKVSVRSWKLACLSQLLFACVGLYMFAYLVLWECKHFGIAAPKGTARLQLQHPVKDRCDPEKSNCKSDFTSFSNLSYCKNGKVQSENVQSRFPCDYWDEHQMQEKGLWQSDHIFIPTRVTKQLQRRNRGCDNGNDPCDNLFSFSDDFVNDKAEHGNTSYVADVERFTLLIDHAYTAQMQHTMSKSTMTGAAHDFTGYWEYCHASGKCQEIRIPCENSCECEGKATRKAEKGSLEEAKKRHIYGITGGDIIPMGEILKLVGINLDDNPLDGGSKTPLRFVGLGIQIDVVYANLATPTCIWDYLSRLWKPGEVYYTYRVTALPVEKYKHFHTEPQQDGNRLLYDSHGMFIFVNVQGSLAYFDNVQCFLMLATFFTLYKIANTLVNLYAETCWHHRGMYKKSKFDASIDFNSFETCCWFVLPDFLTRWLQYCFSSLEKKQKYDGDGATVGTFVKDLVSLDGEALEWGGTVLFNLRQIQDSAFTSRLDKDIASLDKGLRAMGDAGKDEALEFDNDGYAPVYNVS